MNDNTTDIVNTDAAYVNSLERAAIGFANGFVGYNFIYSIIVALLIQFVTVTYNINTSNETLNVILMLITGLITLVLSVFVAGPTKLIKAYNKIGLTQVKLIIKTLFIMLIFTLSYNLFISVLGVDVSGGNTNQTNVVMRIISTPILSFITFVLVAPISEEITYRYFLFGGIRNIAPKFAVLISGFVFMAVHGMAGLFSSNSDILRELLLLPPYMFSGCMLAYSYNKSNNLAVSTGVHVLNNLLSFILSVI